MKITLEVNTSSKLKRVGGGTMISSGKRYPCDVIYEDEKGNKFEFKTTSHVYYDVLQNECTLEDLITTRGVHLVSFNGKCTLQDWDV